MENNKKELEIEKNVNNEEEKEPMTTKDKVFFGLKITGNVLFYVLLLFLFLFAIFNINGGNGTDNFPHIFGSGYLSVQSDSMKRDVNKKMLDEWDNYEIGGFETGDLLKDSVFDEDDADTEHLKVGMVITFVFAKTSTERVLNTHRIVEVHAIENGKVDYVITQGDAKAQEQPYLVAGTKKAEGMTDEQINNYNGLLSESHAIETVLVSNIRGVVKSITPGGGKVLDNIRANYLFYFVLPVAVLLILEIFFVVRNIMILRGEKNKAELEGTREAMLADVEAEKEKMRQELLAEMRAQGLVITDDTKEEPKDEVKVEPIEESKEESVEEKVEENTTEEKDSEPVEEESKEDTSNEVEENKEETEDKTSSEE